ncbi:hypothetical protein CH35J_003663 [Colletotrichum higginsianum]|uniref:Uncharacterized protein n=1 Tax=Colletotrichum higginsianum TaxID=80884 RepID=A0A4T0WA87_9PEZI|nr:hypothetical protein CH35J_003663 [Colletotrichum higginsianum]
MPSYLAAVGAVWAIKRMMHMEFFAPQVIDNRLNPVHLAIGIFGYQIQTEILGIPEQYGFFSSGPPRLQVSQGIMFPAYVSLAAFPLVFLGVIVLLRGNENVDAWILMRFIAITASVTVLFWYLEYADPRRAPDYEWNDWKPHKD